MALSSTACWIRKTWYPCLYDLDSTWGTWTDGTLDSSYEILPENDIADHSTNNMILRVINCFPNELSKRWFNLRDNTLSKQNLIREFTDFKNSIPEESYQKESQRWQNIPGYDYDQIEEFIDFRLDYVDKIMNERYTEKSGNSQNFPIKLIYYLFCIIQITHRIF